MSLRRWALAALLGGALTALAGAEDQSLDDLFDTVNADTVVLVKSGAGVQPTQRPVFLYFGTVETQGAFANGFTRLGDPKSIASSLYYYLHLQGGLDVQPIPQARLLGTFSTYLPQDLDSSIIGNLKSGNTQTGVSTSTSGALNTSSSLGLDELFLDYTVLDTAFFRIGKFSQTWGQGRIFNPGNLVATSGGGVNLKGFVSAGPVTFTGLVIGNTSFFASPSHPVSDELGYAGLSELTLGPVSLGLSAFTQKKLGLTADASLRSSLLDFDLYGEALAYRAVGDMFWPGYLAGAIRDFRLGTVRTIVAAEYWLDGKTHDMARQSVGGGVTVGPMIAGLDLSLSAKIIHSLKDGSGQLVVGASMTPLPKLDIGFGVPYTYGPADGIYVKGNSDPEKRLLAALLTITLKFDFEKER